jgi:ligand-binding SRPBCC domain-containing protein
LGEVEENIEKMTLIEDSIIIHAPIETVFDAERNISLHMETQKYRNEIAIDGVTSGLINLGEEVEWEAVHFGVKQRLRVRITHMNFPTYFRDEMIFGAFQSMSHEHFFHRVDPHTTEKRDVIDFKAPYGIIGRMAERLFLTHYMQTFIQKKNIALKDYIEETV